MVWFDFNFQLDTVVYSVLQTDLIYTLLANFIGHYRRLETM